MSDDLISLEELGGVILDDVEEVRFSFENLPVGSYVGELTNAELTLVGEAKKPVAKFTIKVLECHSLKEDNSEESRASQAEKVHTEMVYFKADSVREDIGRARAMLTDMGAENTGELGPALKAATGSQFAFRIKHRPDKTDPDIIYANMQFPVKKEQKAA